MFCGTRQPLWEQAWFSLLPIPESDESEGTLCSESEPSERIWKPNTLYLSMWPYLEILFACDQVKIGSMEWALNPMGILRKGEI